MEKQIVLDKTDVVEMLVNLHCIVVSLDRIGSASALGRVNGPEQLSEFVKKWDVFRKLSQMRRILLDAHERVTSEGQRERLEKRFEQTSVWSKVSPD